jgi:hypothetical protein
LVDAKDRRGDYNLEKYEDFDSGILHTGASVGMVCKVIAGPKDEAL